MKANLTQFLTVSNSPSFPQSAHESPRLAKAILGIVVFLHENIMIHFQVYLTYLSSGNNFWIRIIKGPPITYDKNRVKANTKPDVLWEGKQKYNNVRCKLKNLPWKQYRNIKSDFTGVYMITFLCQPTLRVISTSCNQRPMSSYRLVWMRYVHFIWFIL